MQNFIPGENIYKKTIVFRVIHFFAFSYRATRTVGTITDFVAPFTSETLKKFRKTNQAIARPLLPACVNVFFFVVKFVKIPFKAETHPTI